MFKITAKQVIDYLIIFLTSLKTFHRQKIDFLGKLAV